MVSAISKGFSGYPKARRFAGPKQRGSWRAKQDQRGIEGLNCAHDRFGKPGVLSCHVVERAVRLDVPQLHAFALCNPGHCRYLIQH